jgi:hypothetical protein
MKLKQKMVIYSGIVSGIWLFVFSVFMIVNTPTRIEIRETSVEFSGIQVIEDSTTTVINKTAVDNIPLITLSIFTASIGLLIIISLTILKNREQLLITLMRICLLGMILCGPFVMGVYAIPAILLLLPVVLRVKDSQKYETDRASL